MEAVTVNQNTIIDLVTANPGLTISGYQKLNSDVNMDTLYYLLTIGKIQAKVRTGVTRGRKQIMRFYPMNYRPKL